MGKEEISIISTFGLCTIYVFVYIPFIDWMIADKDVAAGVMFLGLVVLAIVSFILIRPMSFMRDKK